jgi:hypothetical protein
VGRRAHRTFKMIRAIAAIGMTIDQKVTTAPITAPSETSAAASHRERAPITKPAMRRNAPTKRKTIQNQRSLSPPSSSQSKRSPPRIAPRMYARARRPPRTRTAVPTLLRRMARVYDGRRMKSGAQPLALRPENSERFTRVAVRWHARFCRAMDAGLEEAQAVLAALAALWGPRREQAAHALADPIHWRGLEQASEAVMPWNGGLQRGMGLPVVRMGRPAYCRLRALPHAKYSPKLSTLSTGTGRRPSLVPATLVSRPIRERRCAMCAPASLPEDEMLPGGQASRLGGVRATVLRA